MKSDSWWFWQIDKFKNLNYVVTRIIADNKARSQKKVPKNLYTVYIALLVLKNEGWWKNNLVYQHLFLDIIKN